MSFDILAPHYTWMERVLAGPRLQRARRAWIDALQGCERILMAGVGHGHFLAACVRRFPEARITCVDASAGMLRRAKRRAERAGAHLHRLDFVHAALPAWSAPPGRFDAIATHFFLDCFPPDELAEVVAGLARGAKPQARWLLTDFAVPSGGLARQRARAVHALMYAFFRRVTRLSARRLTEPDPLLAAHGFALRGRKTSEWGLLRSDLWARG
jgi:ubiquinone/menaquinone biosynthesis C-methylase UbiE